MATAGDPQKSLLDRWIDRSKNTVLIGVLVVAGLILAWMASFGGNIKVLHDLLFPPEQWIELYVTASSRVSRSENIGRWKYCREGPPTSNSGNYHCGLEKNANGSYQLKVQVFDTITSATCTAFWMHQYK